AISEKLVDRSRRITMAVTGLKREEAARLVEASGGSVKVALVMGATGASRELARLYLSEADGFVRRALARADAELEAENPYSLYPAAPPDEERLEALRAALRGLARQVGRLVEPATDQALKRRAGPTTWCVKEHIEHLVVCDELARVRISAILSEDQPFLADRNDEVENRAIGESGARNVAKSTLLRRLSDSRAALAFLIEGVAAARLERTGRHERYGLVSVYQILRHLVWHDHRHLLAIRRLLSG
ncbi:MAG: DinB family protein, partial [Gemmatimonadota bacterium]